MQIDSSCQQRSNMRMASHTRMRERSETSTVLDPLVSPTFNKQTNTLSMTTLGGAYQRSASVLLFSGLQVSPQESKSKRTKSA